MSKILIDEATVKLVLEALEGALSDDKPYIENSKKAITALKALADQPAQQEPVAEILSDVNGRLSTQWSDDWTPNPGDKLYTTPPSQRTWVGLTDEEVKQLCLAVGTEPIEVRLIEAKLKEKNT